MNRLRFRYGLIQRGSDVVLAEELHLLARVALRLNAFEELLGALQFALNCCWRLLWWRPARSLGCFVLIGIPLLGAGGLAQS